MCDTEIYLHDFMLKDIPPLISKSY